MKRNVAVAAVVVVAGVIALAIVKRTPSLHKEEAIKIAVEAYIYGYPLVTFDMARRQQTNVAAPDGEHAPMGQMIKMRSYPAVDNHCCAAPNADTLYTIAWLDVSAEPWVFGIPEMGDRYYIMPMLDGFSEVFHVVSAINDGGRPKKYAITGPGWSGAIPEGVTRVESPTAIVWILGRIYCAGTPEDYVAVHALQDQFTVVPLASYGKPYTPPPGVVDPDFDMKTAVRKQVNALGVYTYFDYLANLLKTNPPKADDATMVARMAKIGLVPGQDFDGSALGSLDRKAIEAVPKLALAKMVLHLKQQKTNAGWLFFTSGVGNFGTDYLTRGMANLIGPGWNRPEDAIYPLSQADADGKEYDGAKHRVRDAIREGHAAAGRGLLVAHALRRGLLLRAEPDRPVRPEPAQRARREPGRLHRLLHPGRVAGKGARRPTGCRRPGASSSWCCGCTGRRSARRRSSTARGRRRPCGARGQTVSGEDLHSTRRQGAKEHDEGRPERRSARSGGAHRRSACC